MTRGLAISGDPQSRTQSGGYELADNWLTVTAATPQAHLSTIDRSADRLVRFGVRITNERRGEHGP